MESSRCGAAAPSGEGISAVSGERASAASFEGAGASAEAGTTARRATKAWERIVMTNQRIHTSLLVQVVVREFWTNCASPCSHSETTQGTTDDRELSQLRLSIHYIVIPNERHFGCVIQFVTQFW